MTGIRPLVLAAILSVLYGSVQCEPRELKTFAELVHYLSKGAPVQVSVDIKKCHVDFPPFPGHRLPAYSFTERIEGALYNPNAGLTFNRETFANCTDCAIALPLIRVFELSMNTSGQFLIRVNDLTRTDRRILLSANGTISGNLGSGLTAIATADRGEYLPEFTNVVNALQGAFRVYVNIDIAKCSKQQDRKQDPTQTQGGEPSFTTRIRDYRFSPQGALAFSQHFPARENGEMTVAYGDVKTNSDGSTDVFYYKHKRLSTVDPKREHWSCNLGASIFFYKQA